MNKTVKVRILFTDGCPNASPVIDLIERVANDIGIPVVVDRVLVTSQEQAVKLRCLGSPTIQINGLDIDPSARGSVAFGLGWRNYGASGVPSEDMVKNAILSAVR